MHLHLVRHGEHPPAFRGGWSERGLTEQGHRQAAALSARLAQEGWRVDTLISSDLPRAIETAHHVSQALGVSVIPSEIWREVNNGLLAGMPNVEAEVRFPGLYWSTLRMDQPYPGGESPAQFHARIQRAFDALEADATRGTLGRVIMVITHGGVIDVVYHLALRQPWSNAGPGFPAAPTSLHSFVFEADAWSITRRHDVAHLEGIAAWPADPDTSGWNDFGERRKVERRA